MSLIANSESSDITERALGHHNLAPFITGRQEGQTDEQ